MRKRDAVHKNTSRTSRLTQLEPAKKTLAFGLIALLVFAQTPAWTANKGPDKKLLRNDPSQQSISIDDQSGQTTNRNVISEAQAITIAVNDISRSEDGYDLNNPYHKARFTTQGLHFQAREGGPDWGWSPTHIGDGVKPLKGVHQGKVLPEQTSATSITYFRGELEETYITKIASLEQRFVIRERIDELQGSDLTINGRIQSSGLFEKNDSGWFWSNGKGQVRLGNVYVFDAKGNQIPATMSVTASMTEIVVQGSALEQATYPVTIDPEIGANDFRISDMGPDGDLNYSPYFRTGIAFNSTNNEYLVVWSGDDNTPPLVDGELEIFGQRINATTGAEVGTNDFRISQMGPDGNINFRAAEPKVAYNNLNNEYLVIWHGDHSIDDEIEVWGRRVNAATGNLVLGTIQISDMGPAGNTSYSGAGGTVAFNSNDNEYLVAWYGTDDLPTLAAGEYEIYGQRMNANLGLIGQNDFRISDMGPDGDADIGPAFVFVAAAFNSINDEYFVAWYSDDTINNELEVYGQRINAVTGAQVGTNDFRISDMGPDGDTRFLAFVSGVAYNPLNNEYLVVWNGDDNTGTLVDEEYEMFGQRINAQTGAEVGVNDFRISDLGPNGNTNFAANNFGGTSVSYDLLNNEYLVVFHGEDTTNDKLEVFCQRIDGATGAEVGTNDERISDLGPEGDASYDAIGQNVAHNLVGESLIVWNGLDNVPPLVPGENETFGQRFAVFTRTPTPTVTRTATRTSTRTPTRTITPTPTASATRTATRTPTRTPSFTQTLTPTSTATQTTTWTSTVTATQTPIHTATTTFSPSPSITPSETSTPSPTPSATITQTATSTATASSTNTIPANTNTPSPTTTSTPTQTEIPSTTPTEAPSTTPTQTAIPSTTPTAAPPAPVTLSTSAVTSNSVNLIWTQSGDPAFLRYELWRSSANKVDSGKAVTLFTCLGILILALFSRVTFQKPWSRWVRNIALSGMILLGFNLLTGLVMARSFPEIPRDNPIPGSVKIYETDQRNMLWYENLGLQANTVYNYQLFVITSGGSAGSNLVATETLP